MASDSKTLFVKGIKFSTSKEQLEQPFSEIGPVRSCFLVQYANTDHHKGCAFVQYALADDASRALQELNDSFVDGRRIQVEQARRRAPYEERKQRKRPRGEEDTAQPSQAETAELPQRSKKVKADPAKGSSKQAMVRTVAIGSVSLELLHQVKELAATAGKVESFSYPAADDAVKHLKLDRDGCPSPVLLVQYSTVKEAMHAVSILHSHTVQATQDNEGQKVELWARQAAGEGAHLKKWRVIIRNLPFNAQGSDLRHILSPGGFVWQLSLPRDAKGKLRGFAFATMTCPVDVQKTIKAANGQMLKGRALAVDWAVPKSQFQSGGSTPADEGTDAAQEATAPEADAPSDTEEADKAEGQDEGEREAAAVSEPAGNAGAEQAMLRSLVGQLVSEDQGPATVPAEAPDRQDQAEEPKKEKHKKPEAAAAAPAATQELAHTVFVRGLPPTVTQSLLHAALATFGAVGSCRLVMHKGTGKPKGTAFVEFKTAAGAASAADACEKARAGAGAAVTVKGAPIEVNLAPSQSDVRALAVGKGVGVPSDNRSLYLAREGAIEEGSAAWNALSAADQARRKQAAQDKAAKLKSPNFFVSRTRLSLRNLPRTLDEAALKALATTAVTDHASKARPQIKQVKILRDPARPDKQGKPSSKGIGFAEFSSHEHALCALRELNNNPTTFGADRRPIVEFAIENAQTMKKRQDMQERAKRKAAEAGTETGQAAAKRQKQHSDKAATPAKPAGKKARNDTGSKPPAAAPDTSAAAQAAPPSQGKRKGKAVKGSSESAGRPSQRNHAQAAGAAAGAPKGAKPRQQQGKLQQPRKPQKQGAAEGVPLPSGSVKASKKGGRGEKKDAFDNLAAQYKAKLFGTGGKSGATALQAMKRWFE